MKSLEKDDASLSDMLSFSKEIATGKTVAQEEKEAKDKEEEVVRQQILAQQAKKEAEAKANQPTDYEIEESEKRQKAIDITERKMLAQKYEQMMIEDEKKEGLDNGGSSFQIIADQKAEQDYAINTFKGSGEMSSMMDEMAEDAKKEKAASAKSAKSKAAKDNKAAKTEVTADHGEALIKGDSSSIMEFSASLADEK